MPNISSKELKLLKDKAAVLDYIATEPIGGMSSSILHWYPVPPKNVPFPKDVKPFTKKPKHACTCFDVMGTLNPGEHFPDCPSLKLKGHVIVPGLDPKRKSKRIRI